MRFYTQNRGSWHIHVEDRTFKSTQRTETVRYSKPCDSSIPNPSLVYVPSFTPTYSSLSSLQMLYLTYGIPFHSGTPPSPSMTPSLKFADCDFLIYSSVFSAILMRHASHASLPSFSSTLTILSSSVM